MRFLGRRAMACVPQMGRTVASKAQMGAREGVPADPAPREHQDMCDVFG